MPEKTTGVNVAGVDGCIGGTSGRDDGGPAIAIVYATFPSIGSAEAIGESLVEAGLAGCVNLIRGMRSIYRWEGEIHRDEEVVMVAKTRVDLTERLAGWVRVLHPYTNPAIVVIPVIGGSVPFLDWVAAETVLACSG